MGLKEAIGVVAGLAGDPTGVDLEKLLEGGYRSELSRSVVRHIQGVADPRTRRSIKWVLSDVVTQLDQAVEQARRAKTIAGMLPQIEKILADWTDPSKAPRTDLPDHENPIHILQKELGVTHDGKFGEKVSEALLRYETSGIQNGFAGGHTIDTRQYPALHDYLRTNSRTAFDARNSAIEAKARIAGLNQFIASEFEKCTGTVIDLTKDDPFKGILQEVTAFAQTAEETPIAHGKVAQAIIGACGRYLNQIKDEGLKASLVEKLATKLEEPLNDAVQTAINDANHEFALERFQAGRDHEAGRVYSPR